MQDYTDLSVQLTNPENELERWFPVTLAALVRMANGADLVTELGKYLKATTNSVTGAPYVADVSVNAAGTKLKVKTWSKEANGTLKEEEIAIVGTNTTYTLSAKMNTQDDATQGPNSAVRLTDSDGNNYDAKVPMGALINDDYVEVVLNGNFD